MTGAPWILGNAVAATALAVSVALVARRVRRPALVHAAWGAVLLRFVAVPVFGWPVLPSWSGPPACVPAEAAPAAAWSPGVAPPGVAMPAHADLASSGAALLPLAALAGTLALLSLALVRALRFARRLRRVPLAPPALQARADRVARELGLPRAPRVRVAALRIAPAVTAAPRPEIVLPAGLLARLPDAQLDALLAHELAHVKRRDPWLRPLELLIVALWWWHPVAWWARRNLRAAEERACDALVLRHRPDRARAYADALVSAAAFLVPPRTEVPVLATGFGVRQLEERLTMILHGSPERPLGRRALFAAGAVLGLALLVAPTSDVPAATPDDLAPSSPAPVASPPRPGAPAATPAPVAPPAPLGVTSETPAPLPPAPPLPKLEAEFRALEAELLALEARHAELTARAAELRPEMEEMARRAEDAARQAEFLARRAAEMERQREAMEAQRRAMREAAPPESFGPEVAPEPGATPPPDSDDGC